ncbi:PilZ domain-containing protein [Photobacterium atrarenae]|uniref:PilZ domain-containing protein n=1 Tax=Photobacterium atrarenae TaxID=865757 RepID=A0ABY5GDA9_9GAMM|nr:PilZ domain-containing protein [Photobacterium atrarenae]UTV27232.1 PilZ domain-containing protein [Photobacterium atrarenae]
MLPDTQKGLIEQLIPVYDSEDFDDVFQMMTQDASGPVKLQIKMELNRIMAPCYQIVDLRGRVNGECRPYELNGLVHWLDDVALNTYHKRIKIFGGKYRVGLYEALMNTRNNFRVLHQQQKQTTVTEASAPQRDTQFDATLIRFGHYLTRQENRLRMSTPVNLTLPFNQHVHGTTSDLSYSGAKFKVPSAFKYGLGQTIKATFPKLAEDYRDKRLNQETEYRIVGIDDSKDNDSFRWLRLKRISDNIAIREAIDRSQRTPQQRVRKNYDDKVIQVRTKGYEHCYLKHTTSMPMFFAGDQLKYCLLTNHNRHIWDNWHDERNQPVINHLLSKERMATLGKPGLKQCSTLIYSFCHEHDNKSYYYSAALPELTKEQRSLFWHVGAARKSWRVSRLTIQPIEPEDLARLQEIAPDMYEQLNKLTHIGILQDLTNEHAQPDYRLAVKPKLPGRTLQSFRHPRNPVATAKAIFFDPKPQRSESRFKFETKVLLQHQTQPPVEGTSVDLSIHGLNLNLSYPLPIKRGDNVSITFEDLQKRDKKAPLSQIPYTVVRVSPDFTNIQMTTGSGAIAMKGEQYLRRLIQQNEQALPVVAERLPKGELLLAMHQMLLTRLNTIPYFTEKENHKVKLKAFGCNFPIPALPKLFNQVAGGALFSLEPIFKNRLNRMLAEPMRPVEIRKPYIHELYLWIERNGDQPPRIESRLIDEFDSIEERIQFIKQARRKGEFMALRVTAVPVLEPMTALSGMELSELARMTLHRARTLENEFTSLIGCGEIYDITDEVLIRLELT